MAIPKLATSNDWKAAGIRDVWASAKNDLTPETKGVNRRVAISGSRTGSQALWAGTNHIKPSEITAAHTS